MSRELKGAATNNPTLSITDVCFLTPGQLEDIWLDVCPGCKATVSALKHDFSLCTQLQNALFRIRELEKKLELLNA